MSLIWTIGAGRAPLEIRVSGVTPSPATENDPRRRDFTIVPGGAGRMRPAARFWAGVSYENLRAAATLKRKFSGISRKIDTF